MEQTHYEMLGVHSTASRSDILRAYSNLRRELAARGDQAQLQSITRAFNVLKDSRRRAEYDRQIGTTDREEDRREQEERERRERDRRRREERERQERERREQFLLWQRMERERHQREEDARRQWEEQERDRKAVEQEHLRPKRHRSGWLRFVTAGYVRLAAVVGLLITLSAVSFGLYASGWQFPSFAPVPTPTPAPTPTIQPLPTATLPPLTATPLPPPPTPTPTATPLPTPTATQLPTATPSPTPTVTPRPTVSPIDRAAAAYASCNGRYTDEVREQRYAAARHILVQGYRTVADLLQLVRETCGGTIAPGR